MYELFEHTADLGLRVRAADLPGVFADAGRGLAAMIVDNVDAVRPTASATIQIAGSDRDYLLFDWLNELLYRFESERWLYVDFDVHIADDGLTAVARGERFDPPRHQPGHEVKAITYHRLKVEQTAAGWLAELIVDI